MKQHTYSLNPVKQQILREVKYLLDNDLIEPSQSEWSSPCILVPKPDGHFVCVWTIVKHILLPKQTHFPSRESMTASITLDKPNMLQNLVCLKHLCKCLLQTEQRRSQRLLLQMDCISTLMPFGMKNSPAIFQCLVNSLISKFG